MDVIASIKRTFGSAHFLWTELPWALRPGLILGALCQIPTNFPYSIQVKSPSYLCPKSLSRHVSRLIRSYEEQSSIKEARRSEIGKNCSQWRTEQLRLPCPGDRRPTCLLVARPIRPVDRGGKRSSSNSESRAWYHMQYSVSSKTPESGSE